MSVAYEPRSFLHGGNYPPIGDEPDHADPRFHSEVAEHLSHYAADAGILPDDQGVMVQDVMVNERDMLVQDDAVLHDASQLDLDVAAFSSPLQVPLHVALPEPMSEVKLTPAAALPHTHVHAHSQMLSHPSPHLDSHSSPNLHPHPSPQLHPLPHPLPVQHAQPHPAPPSRAKPIPKPDREAHKEPDGKYHCKFEGCKEEIRSFSRKCEWNKHMDKHERPYRCDAPGCENLPGFTYSGGLLRHEREVHRAHGGPKNTVNCPHPTCKRHTGKGFSRQENLNEHLRRVHTNMDAVSPPYEAPASPEEDESERSVVGTKRKRRSSSYDEELAELREELKRAKEENNDLRVRFEKQSISMMARLTQLQNMLHHELSTDAND